MEPLTILCGDVREKLRELPDNSIQCCVTSPPYWGLRDYQSDGQIGLEHTFEEWLAKMTFVFSEVRRVLKPDGTCWVNVGDSYAMDSKWGGQSGSKNYTSATGGCSRSKKSSGLKDKDLVGQPWELAFALRSDGWYLRRDIIWHKPNAMPESAKDRPSTCHEYVFLFSKSKRYFYDYKAIMEPATGGAHARGNGVNPKCAGWADGPGSHHPVHHAKPGGSYKGSVPGRNGGPGQERRSTKPRQNASFSGSVSAIVEMRNKRSVWSIPTQGFPDAHFATYPPDLIKPCIMAGSRVGDTILDPFAGSGTTGMVALELGRKATLIELNPDYVKLIEQRTHVTPGLPLVA